MISVGFAKTCLQVPVGVGGIEAGRLRGVTRLVGRGSETGRWEGLDPKRRPALIWRGEERSMNTIA